MLVSSRMTDVRRLPSDGVLERGFIQIGADNPKVSILAQNLCQTAPDQRIKASERDNDVSRLVIRPLIGGAGQSTDRDRVILHPVGRLAGRRASNARAAMLVVVVPAQTPLGQHVRRRAERRLRCDSMTFSRGHKRSPMRAGIP
jgi:hypothetical protein